MFLAVGDDDEKDWGWEQKTMTTFDRYPPAWLRAFLKLERHSFQRLYTMDQTNQSTREMAEGPEM